MTYIPKGKYLSALQYQHKLGIRSKYTVVKACRENRIKGVIWLDKDTPLIPEDAIMVNKTLKNGKYIGVSAWLKGEVVHQEEVRNWERHQAQLKKMRENDIT